MINHLIAWSLRRRFAVLLASLVILGYGSYTALRMPVDVFPDLTAPTVTIVVEGRGMAPEEMEPLVTFPIETAVNGATQVRRVRSATGIGIAVIWVEFEWGTDIQRARQTVTERLATVAASLPEHVEPPVLAPISSMMGEILFVGLTSDRHSGLELRDTARLQLERRLLSVEGVSKITPIGGDERQFQVVLSTARMRALDISRGQVAEALRAGNENVSAGFLIDGGAETILRGIGRYTNIEQIAATVVERRETRSITVEDVALVQVGSAIKRGTAALSTRDEEGIARTQDAVVLAVQKQPSANTLELTRTLDGVLDEIQASLPAGMQVHKRLFRQADFIENSIANTTSALIEGALFVVLVVVLFLASFQASLITLLAIPISLLTAVLALALFGVSINTMTLGGMAIAIGSLVDDAIIDVENVVRRLRENRRRPKEQRLPSLRVIYLASAEVRTSIVLATGIILLVFAPLFFLSGVEGRLLVPLGAAFCVALAASLVTALTLTPALCAVLLPESKTIRKVEEPKLVSLLKRMYAGPLRFAMRFPMAVVLPSLIAFVFSVIVAGRMGKNFLPEFNEGALIVGLVSLPGTSLEQSDQLASLAQLALMEHPEVVAMSRRTGRAEADEHVQGVEASELEIMLDMEASVARGFPRRSKAELLDAMRSDLARVPGLQATFGQPIGHRVDHMLSGTRANIAVKIFGDELGELRSLAAKVEAEMTGIPGIVDLSTDQQVEVAQLRVEFDRPALARYGLSVAEASRALEAAYQGEIIGEVLVGRQSYDLSLRLADGEGARRDAVGEILIDTPQGLKVPMRSVARLVDGRGPNFITRENVQRKIVVMCNVAGRDMEGVVTDIRAAIEAGVSFPPGYFVQYGGQFETATAANRRLAVLGIIAILGIALLLGSMFRSLREVLLIMLNLPLALIGGVVGVALSGGVISIASIIGFVSVFGIAARNGIMLVSHVRHLQEEEGVDDFPEAVRRAAMERLAPILMTAISAGLALIPLALRGDEPGTEILTPMAIVILFGLISSTLLNMLVVPALFVRVGRRAADPNLEDSPTQEHASERSSGPGLAFLLLIGLGFTVPACASFEPEDDYARAAEAVEASTGRSDLRLPDSPRMNWAEVESILADGLSLEDAQLLTLAHHPGLRARFLEIGIGHADWLQAKLLANPFLDFALRFPSGGGGSILEAVLGFELLDLWQAPARTELARRNLDATILAIAFEAAQALDATRRAYFQAVYAEATRKLAFEEGEIRDYQWELARIRVDAGAADRLELSAAQLAAQDFALLYPSVEAESHRARSALARSLSIRDSLLGTDLVDSHSESTAQDPDVGLMRFLKSNQLIQAALDSRLDLQALAMTTQALQSRVNWEESRVWPQASAGVGFESPKAGDEIGAALSLQLPIFDRNQAQIARAKLLLKQAELMLEQARIEVGHDISDAAQRYVRASYDLHSARLGLEPTAREALELAVQARAAGSATTDTVLDARIRLLSVRRALLQLKLEVVLAASALERELGQPISSAYSGSDK
jgi:CzcA family heavy metal efflux pump